MADIEFKRKDKRSKQKKLKLFTSTAPNSKVRPHLSVECSNSSIKRSESSKSQNYVKKEVISDYRYPSANTVSYSADSLNTHF